MEQIKDTLKTVIENLTTKQKETVGSDVNGFLKKLLTKKELGHIRVNNFKKGILYINVDSSSWLYALSLRKKELVEKLRRSQAELKDIRFFLGETK